LLLAASALRGLPGTDTLEGIYMNLNGELSPLVGGLFGLSLLVSGLASTAVGSHAGAVIMDGMIKRRISIFTRRIITIIPALVIVAFGVDPTKALIISQVILSFGIPFALIPLLLISASNRIMGAYKNTMSINILLSLITLVIIVLNLALIVLTVLGL